MGQYDMDWVKQGQEKQRGEEDQVGVEGFGMFWEFE